MCRKSGFWEGINLAAFSGFLNDNSLTPPQMRFVEMIIDQLTSRGIMEAAALYEAPFSNLHAGGPEALFAGKETVITGIFDALASSRRLKSWTSAVSSTIATSTAAARNHAL